MGSKATTFNTQIQLLQSRGMTFDIPIPKVIEFLSDIGYYRLGFYWNPFEKNQNHEFITGTKISDVIALYYLDVDLRSLLHKYLNRIEVNFKTKLIYHASNKYISSPIWFVDKRYMKTLFVEGFDKIYNEKFKNDNKSIKKHHSKYINDKYAPAWKTLEYLTFGSNFMIYRNLIDINLKEAIANEYGIKRIEVFENYFNNIIRIRNVCSHSGVLFDLKLFQGLRNIPTISFNEGDRHSLDACIKVIVFTLNSISKNRAKEMQDEVEQLFRRHVNNPILKSIIKSKVGYVF
jgi:abortive infection bacteriophage resistance protein